MSLQLRRINLAAGDEYYVRYRDGCRAVYLVEGSCSPLKYAKPITIMEGHMVKVVAREASIIGVFGVPKP